MKHLKLAALALALASCFGGGSDRGVVYLTDLEVSWTLDGQQGAALCTQYGVAHWRVSMSGPELLDAYDFACGALWNSGQTYYGIAEGTWSITLTALDASGAALASQAQSVQILADGVTIWTADFPFAATDFAGDATTDLEVSWTLDAQQAAAKCSEYGVAKWRVEMSGPQVVDAFDFACGAAWSSGQTYHGIAAGSWNISLSALDAGDAVLALQTQARQLASDATTIWTVDFPFTAADFAPEGSLIIAWKISGTTDGTQTGPSWDSCDEVGATQVAVTVGSTTTTHPCSANNMSATLTGLELGNHAVSVVLEDQSSVALTTAATRELVASTTPSQAPFIFNFDGFLEPLKTGTDGDYLYETVFQSSSNPLTCGQTNPVAGQRLVLLTLDGDVIDAESCPSAGGAVCTATDASAFGPCVDGQQQIAGLRWGMYKIKLQAAPASSTTLCWQAEDAGDNNEVDIIVGAGNVNPVDRFVLERIDSSGDCMPL